MALAGTVAVGVGIDTILDDEDESSAETMPSSTVTAKADTNLMKTMVYVCVVIGWRGWRDLW